MAQESKTDGNPISLRVSNADKTERKDGEVKVPLELSSINQSVRVVKEGDEVSIYVNPTIAEEIGAYRRCNVMIKFKEMGQVQVIPLDLK